MTHPDNPAELAKAISSAARLAPARRAARYRRLVDAAKAVLSQAADEAIVEALAGCSYAEMAEQLDVSPAAINKAVSRHRARRNAEPQS